MRIFIWFAVLTLSAATVQAAKLGDNLVNLAPSTLRLPQNIGPLRYGGENRYSDRRLGRSFAYNTSGISLNIYVYDYGLRDLPEGPDSIAVCEQFEGARGEIENGGNYDNVQVRSVMSRRTLPTADALRVREAVYEFDRNGVHALSVLWLTAAQGHFIKLRLSLRAEIADELEDARPQILAAIADAVADAKSRTASKSALSRAPAPGVTVELPGESSIDMDAGIDPAEAALWLVYALELTRFSSEHPEIRPPCGGRLAPGFAAELSARRAALLEYRARAPAARTSSYFNQLERIDAAGFLDEYVWHYLRNPKWDLTPPPDTELGAFESYRLHELADHSAQSGARVRINEVRVLPLAP